MVGSERMNGLAMIEQELYEAIARRSGAATEEVGMVVRELFPQAFALAAERGGKLVVPYFGTFACEPHADHGAMQYRFRPRRPEELIRALKARRGKLAGRRRGSESGGRFRNMPKLNGETYVPQPGTPPGAGPRPQWGGEPAEDCD